MSPVGTRRASSLLLVAAVVLGGRTATAAEPRLIGNLASTHSGQAASSSPGQLRAFRDGVLFLATVEGRTVLAYDDRTVGGRRILATLLDHRYSLFDFEMEVGQDVAYLGLLRQSRQGYSFESALLRSDGTTSGTFLLFDDHRISGLGDDAIALLDDEAYFTRCDTSGCQRWRTRDKGRSLEPWTEDPTEVYGSYWGLPKHVCYRAGDRGRTLRCTDGRGSVQTISETFERLEWQTSDHLFFLAFDGSRTLWATDGTAAGTERLPDEIVPRFVPGPSGLEVEEGISFVKEHPDYRYELWFSDGTAAGTRALTEVGAATDIRGVSAALASADGHLVFLGSRASGETDLWTVEIARGPSSVRRLAREVTPLHFIDLGAKVAIILRDEDYDVDLVTFDGSRLETVLDLCPQAFCEFWPPPVAGGQGLGYFRFGADLWRTDGTSSGTFPLTQALELDPGLSNIDLAPIGNGVYFAYTDRAHGQELWFGGAAPGSGRLAFDVDAGEPSSLPHSFALAGGRIFFTACSDHGTVTRLWSSYPSAPFAPEPIPGLMNDRRCEESFRHDPASRLPVVGDRVLYVQSKRLVLTDGTEQGTVDVHDDVELLALEEFQGGLLYVTDANGPSDWVLRRFEHDGRSTVVFQSYHYEPPRLEIVGDRAFFLGTNDDEDPVALWSTDGTASGTIKVGHAGAPPGFRSTGELQVGELSGSYFFSGEAEDLGHELWMTNGSSESATLFMDLAPGQPSSDPTDFVAMGDYLFFAATVWSGGRGLWRTDGTVAGTELLFSATPRAPTTSTLPTPIELTAVHDRLVFTVDDGIHGRELWISDGTASGTRLVVDLVPGPHGSNPTQLTAAGDQVFFTATVPGLGNELWTSRGTAETTRLVADLAPGEASAAPQQLAFLGDTLYFSADDGIVGREPWAYTPGPPAVCQQDEWSLCLADGSYRVTIDWRSSQGPLERAHAVPLTADTGAFWFFSSSNLEAMVKVLDARAVNDHVWVYFGALSDVEYAVTVTEVATGGARRYMSSGGAFASLGDVHAFGPLGATTGRTVESRFEPALAPLVARSAPASSSSGGRTCRNDDSRVCLAGRFEVSVRWSAQGGDGDGRSRVLTTDTGAFSFFDAANLELMVKVLDASAVNGSFWVYYASLSDVGFEITVVDTLTGDARVYVNPPGSLASSGDSMAFPSP